MARKHHCKHNRTPGGYARRLESRGLSRTPQMTHYPDLDQRGKQGRVTTPERKRS